MRKDFISLFWRLYSSDFFILIGTLLYNRIPILIKLFNRAFYYKFWYVNPYLSLYYDHVPIYFFCTDDLYFFKKHNTSNTYNEITVSVLQSLNKLFVNFGGHESYHWYYFHPLFPLITCQIMGIKTILEKIPLPSQITKPWDVKNWRIFLSKWKIVYCTTSRECHVLEAWNI